MLACFTSEYYLEIQTEAQGLSTNRGVSADQLRIRLGVSPEVRQHLVDSQIEFLKAIREVINDRIEHLSKKAEQGTKIPVE